MSGSPGKPAVHGPAARMRCRRCGQVFTVRPGHIIAHDRRQGAVYVNCAGELVADVVGAQLDVLTSEEARRRGVT